MSHPRKVDLEPDSRDELPLFESSPAPPSANDVATDLALQVINRDLALWDGIAVRARVDRRSERDRKAVVDLGRDLRALRDCYLASSHPRVRRALLIEAGAITRRMMALGKRLRVRGLAIRALEFGATVH